MNVITERHEIEKVQSDLLPHLINQWALLTAGEGDEWNTMPIAWGAFGCGKVAACMARLRHVGEAYG